MSFGGRHVGVGAALERAVGFPHQLCPAAAPGGPQRCAVSAAGLGIWEGPGLVPRAGIAVAAAEMSYPWS